MTKSNSNVHASTVHIRTNLLREVINKLSVDETRNAVTDNFLASRRGVVGERQNFLLGYERGEEVGIEE